MERPNKNQSLASTSCTDSGVGIGTGSDGSHALPGAPSNPQSTNLSNSQTTSAIDLSDSHMQDDIPLDEEHEHGRHCDSDLTEEAEALVSLREHHPDERLISNRVSSDSGSTFEVVNFQSEDEWCTSMDMVNDRLSLLKKGESETSSSKVCESDNFEERDTFSPVSLDMDLTENRNIDNIALSDTEEESSGDNQGAVESRIQLPLSTKEQKQRQNEEIVIMESSSLSSKTGSWESVFPPKLNTDLQDSCKQFIKQERSHCSLNLGASCSNSQHNASDYDDAKTPIMLSPQVVAAVAAGQHNAAFSGCFIDASTLFDDDEVPYASFSEPQLPGTGCFGPKPLVDACDGSPDVDDDDDGLSARENLSLLESIDREMKSSSEHNSAAAEDDSEKNCQNLSDEQKLISQKQVIIKDQFSIDPKEDAKVFSDSQDHDSGFNRQCSLDSNDPQAKIRQEQERKQGTLVFQSSIQQFSGHVISQNVACHDDGYSDFSISSAYSSEPNNETSSIYDSSPRYRKDDYDDSSSRNQSEMGSVIYPDTPHNSIITVNMSMNGGHTSHTSQSGSMETSGTQSSGSVRIPRKMLKCDESAPIVSGGASIKDFTPRQCDSPPVMRKTEMCPIVSGGLLPSDFEDEDEKKSRYVEKPKLSASVASWVVDMSDCNLTKNGRRRRSESSSSSMENGARSLEIFSSESNTSSVPGKNSLGYFVSLSDLKPPKPLVEGVESESSRPESVTDSMKKSEGFFVDFKNSKEDSPLKKKVQELKEVKKEENSDDKKNIFSMFIDFGDKKQLPRPSSFVSKLTASLSKKKEPTQKQPEEMSSGSYPKKEIESKAVSKRDPIKLVDVDQKKSTYMYIEGDTPPVVLRRPQLVSKTDSKRHSWNTSASPSNNSERLEKSKADYKRSASISTDKGIMNILDKLPLISKTSSMSIDSSISPHEDFTYSKSELSFTNSIVSSVGSHRAEMNEIMTSSTKRRQRDAKINETFDKSSQGSLTDGVFSKDSSPMSTTDTDDITFQNEVEKEVKNKMMETIIEARETNSPKKQPYVPPPPVEMAGAHTMESLQATIEKQKQLLETVSEVAETTTAPASSSSNFVKLSDLDKPAPKFEAAETLSKSLNSSNRTNTNRSSYMDGRNTIGGGNRYWSNNMSRSTGNNLINLASSVENLKSLSRLFPHLSKDLSYSLPTDIQINTIRTPIAEYDFASDVSATSSLASSISRSGLEESAEESSLSCRQPRRLGEDLLKMFLQEIATDVTVEVGGRRLKAHKCILRSRCQYFAAILAGGWVQSAGNVISIPGYSYGAVHFALCHIYSGAAHPPEGISLMELSALADLLGLEGLKEVTEHALKINYCHNFHKPCSGCIEGILQVLPVTLNHGLDELYRKCIRWTCKHYIKVWPTRAFAQLPSDMISRCRQQVLAHLTSENVLTTILDCDHMLSLLAPCKWASGVEGIVRGIIDSAQNYLCDHFASLIASDYFLSLGQSQSWNISRLESIILQSASILGADQACRSYQRITRLTAVLGAQSIKMPVDDNDLARIKAIECAQDDIDWNEDFMKLVGAIFLAVEQCLTRQCARAMRTSAWQRMDVEMRKKIQKLACLSEPLDLKRSRLSNKPLSMNQYVPNSSRNQDLYQVRLAIQAHSRRVMNQDYQQYQATTHTQTNHFERDAQTYEKVTKINNIEPEARGRLTAKPKPAERSRLQVHQRSQSETITSKSTTFRAKSANASSSQVIPTHATHPVQPSTGPTSLIKPAAKLGAIRPRYLEPRRPRSGPLKSQTTGNIMTQKARHISSSDSSTRTSSPAANKRGQLTVGKKKESTNMSLDSLASPAKQSKVLKTKNATQMDISIDSLGESLKSSMKTDKTMSQESIRSKSKENISRPFLGARSENDRRLGLILNKNGRKSVQTTASNSPMSATGGGVTRNGGRLSTTTSSVSSPRDGYKGRNSATASVAPVRKSFLSARSREILAKRTLKESDSTKSVPNVSKTSGNIRTTSVNKSSSSTNIVAPKVFTNKQVTPLMQRRSMGAPQPNVPNGAVNKSRGLQKAIISVQNDVVKKSVDYVKKAVNEMRENLIIDPEPQKSMKFVSKLERSSTFSKECSDIPASELQIIE